MSVERLEADLLRARAPNPGPLTGGGTNSYVLGRDSVIVIDPGPAIQAHLTALLRAIDGRPVEKILVTHSHLDHSPLARALAAETHAPVAAFGPSGTGRSPIMAELARSGEVGGGEGVDTEFAPDIALTDGAEIALENERITALHTPGHFGNHMCFAWRDILFAGDLVMGWATTLISPPDGDLTDFMASCARLKERHDRVYYPGHGDPIAAPATRVTELVTHRRAREAQVLEALKNGPATPGELTQIIYRDVATSLWPAAERNVLAHLIDLLTKGHVVPTGPVSRDAKFALK